MPYLGLKDKPNKITSIDVMKRGVSYMRETGSYWVKGAKNRVYDLEGTCRPYDERHAQVSLRTQAKMIWVLKAWRICFDT